jgi:dihydroxyacetone kinase-like predicted kinase
MAEAAGACRYAEVTIATREALTMAGRCAPGDVLALIEGEVVLVGADVASAGRTLLDRMLAGGGELVTLILGAQAPDGLADILCQHLAQRWPFAESTVYSGDQPHYPLLVGVE